jgi:3-deoxy-D-manno-octulosonic-acid transferase
MLHLIYNLLLVIASPVILAILFVKPRCRPGLTQRFGFSLPSIAPDARTLVWIHAVSLGEVVAITPLVKELHRRYPDHRFVVSTATETGREAVSQRLAGIAEHLYAPLDFPWSVARTIAHLRPRLYIFIETELWPNLLRQLSKLGVPTIMVNGRLSSRSFARQQWEPIRSFYGTILRSLRLCLMQSDRDVERIISLGADPQSVHCTGNIKFDQPLPTSTERKVTRADLGIPKEAPLIIAGSTHPGEEEMLIDAYMAIIRRYPSARLLMAPRHIERADAVEAMIRARGLTVQRRSASDHHEDKEHTGVPVILLDTRGELALVYQEATVAFVGGTLIPIGGHNLLEPALWGKPVVFGPYTDHCVEIAELLLQAGGGQRVMRVDDLTYQILQIFDRPEIGVSMGQAAQSVVQQNQGALQRTIEAIDGVLASARSTHPSCFSQDPFPLMAGR